MPDRNPTPPVFRIRIGLNTGSDPETAFFLNADPDPGSKINANLDSVQASRPQKVYFLHKNLLFVDLYTIRNMVQRQLNDQRIRFIYES
jgi:hypothetical protein